MARIVGRNAKIYFAGYDISGRSNSFTLGITSEAPEVTGFGTGTRERLADGLRDAELSMDGFYDTAASNTDAIFSAYMAASTYVSIIPLGSTACSNGYSFAGILTNYEIAGNVGEAVAISTTITGSPPFAVVKSFGTTSATSGSGVSAEVDFAASTVNTWGFLHVLDFNASSIGASLQHSDDAATWVTLIDFGTLTYGGQSLATKAASSNRHRRIKYNLTGTAVTLFATSGSQLTE